MALLMLLLMTVCSAIFYRAGGLGKDSQEKWSKWIPKAMRHSWVRDWICPFFVLMPLFLARMPLNWTNVGLATICYGLIGGSLTTYWDWLFNDWDNFWFAGFMCGVALFPLIFAGIAWYWLVLRALVLAICWGGWCAIFSNADIEEYGRGAFLPLTLLILGG